MKGSGAVEAVRLTFIKIAECNLYCQPGLHLDALNISIDLDGSEALALSFVVEEANEDY
ncbi:hypothetical protein U2F10_02675 [Leptothoe sp. EHU-05/26/07-4]